MKKIRNEFRKINREDVLVFVKNNITKHKYIIFFKNNLEKILRKSRLRNIGNIIELFSEYKILRMQIVKKFNNLKDLIILSNVIEILNIFIKYQEYSILIEENIDVFLDCAIKTNINDDKTIINDSCLNTTKEKEIFDILRSYSYRTQEIILNLEDCIEKYRNNVIIKYLNRGILYRIFTYYSIPKFLDDLKKYNIFENNVTFFKYGFFNTVFKYNNRILKIGKKKVKFKLPYSNFILQPYIRKEIYINKHFIYTIEIVDEVDTFNINNQSLKYVLQSLNKEKKEWLDASINNIGILKEGNFNKRKNKFKEIGMSFSFRLCKNKSNVVIIDSDMIFTRHEVQKWNRRYK